MIGKVITFQISLERRDAIPLVERAVYPPNRPTSPMSIRTLLWPYLLLANISMAISPTVTPRYVSNSQVVMRSQMMSGLSLGLLSTLR